MTRKQLIFRLEELEDQAAKAGFYEVANALLTLQWGIENGMDKELQSRMGELMPERPKLAKLQGGPGDGMVVVPNPDGMVIIGEAPGMRPFIVRSDDDAPEAMNRMTSYQDAGSTDNNHCVYRPYIAAEKNDPNWNGETDG